MDYKHRKRRTPDARGSDRVQGHWTPTYYGSNLELSLEGRARSDDGGGINGGPVDIDTGRVVTNAGRAVANANSAAAAVRPKSALRGSGGGESDRADQRKQPKQRNGILGLGRPKSAGKQRTTSAGKKRTLSTGKQRTTSVGKQRAASTEQQRAMSAGKQRSAVEATTSAGKQRNADGSRKGWGGFLRRKKFSKQQQQQLGEETTSQGKCDFCGRVAKGKRRSQMLQRAGYAYCSTDCTKRHHQALNANEPKTVADNATPVKANRGDSNYFRSGFSPPPSFSDRDADNDDREGRTVTFPNSHSEDSLRQQPSSEEFNLIQYDEADERSRKKQTFIHTFNCFHHEDDENGNVVNAFSGRGLEPSPRHEGFGSWSDNRKNKPLTPSSIHMAYGRGVSDEYRDYNDELSRQLTMAARQDVMEAEERQYQKRRFIDEHCTHTGVKDSSPDRFSNVSNTYSDRNIGESSPGRYHEQLREVGSTVNNGSGSGGSKINSNKNVKIVPPPSGKSRRKLPLAKQNENSTQSTESVSSSSHGGSFGHHSPLIADKNSPQPALGTVSSNTSSRTSPWGYLDDENGTINCSWVLYGSQDMQEEAFGDMVEWPVNINDGKTPRMKNLSLKSDNGAIESDGERQHDRKGKAMDPEEETDEGGRVASKSGGLKTANASKNYARQVSSLSRSPTPLEALRPISEEQSMVASEIDKMNEDGGRFDDHRAVDRAREEEMVSQYDDPSVDMMSSLGTNDTMTTKSMERAPSNSPTVAALPWESNQRSGADDVRRRRRQQGCADPPGSSIDDILRGGIHGGSCGLPYHYRSNVMNARQEAYVRRGRDPSFQGPDPSVSGTDPSFNVSDPDSTPTRSNGLSPLESSLRRERSSQGHMLSTIQFQPRQGRWQEQQQQVGPPRRQLFPEQATTLAMTQSDRSPYIETPPQLRTRGHEWRWSEDVPAPHGTSPPTVTPAATAAPSARLIKKANERAPSTRLGDNVERFDKDREDGDFYVGDIEFLAREKLRKSEDDEEDASMTILTGEEDEEGLPPLSGSKGDDDTATNTMDTVDLVAEVKRVWRHVQRYEKKKKRKQRLRRQHSSQGRGRTNGKFVEVSGLTIDESGLTIDKSEAMIAEDANNEEGLDDALMMGSLMRQFSEIQMQRRRAGHSPGTQGGESKLSDITPSSSHRARAVGAGEEPDEGVTARATSAERAAGAASSRGRSAVRMADQVDDNGRLGKHIRSTSAHSQQHTPIPDSPGLDSNHAMASNTSTERDVVFINEGVDGFYEGHEEPEMVQQSRPPPTSHPSPRRHTLERMQRTSPSALQQLSEGLGLSNTGGEEGDEPIQQRHNHLSKPYDMTKTRSSGTSFTQRTEKTSNATDVAAVSALRAQMARKYHDKLQRGQQQRQQLQREQGRDADATDAGKPPREGHRRQHQWEPYYPGAAPALCRETAWQRQEQRPWRIGQQQGGGGGLRSEPPRTAGEGRRTHGDGENKDVSRVS